jgi:50S ribosomal subunit-associated GTPase HflX
MHPIILKALHATLGELAAADLVLLFVDASDEVFPLERKVRACSQTLREVDITSPTIVCANKIDMVSPEQLEESISMIRRYFLDEDIVPLSIKKDSNVDKVLSLIQSKLQAQRLIVNPRKPEALR